MVDAGESDGSFIPTSGKIKGFPIIITDAVTSGSSSQYTLTF